MIHFKYLAHTATRNSSKVLLLFAFPRVYNILDSGYSDRRFSDIRGKNALPGIGGCRTENFVILRMLLSSEHGTYQHLRSEK